MDYGQKKIIIPCILKIDIKLSLLEKRTMVEYALMGYCHHLQKPGSNELPRASFRLYNAIMGVHDINFPI